MAALRKFLTTTKNKIKSSTIGGGKSKRQNDDEEFERRKQQWQEDLEEMSDFLVLKSTEEQRAEGVECPVDTALVEDRDGLPILKAVFDIHHFRPDDVSLTVENVSAENEDETAALNNEAGNSNGNGDCASTTTAASTAPTRRQLVLFAQCLDDSRECSIFKKTMLRRIDLPDYVETRWMHCRLERPPRSTSSRNTSGPSTSFEGAGVGSPQNTLLIIELPFHLPPQRRPSFGPGIVPIQTDSDGRRVIRFTVPIGPDFTTDDVNVNVDRETRQVTVSARYEAEIGHYGTEVTQRRIQRVFRLPSNSLEWDAVEHRLDPDGNLNVEIKLQPVRPYRYDLTVEELELVPADAADDDDVVSLMTENDGGEQQQQQQQQQPVAEEEHQPNRTRFDKSLTDGVPVER